MSVRLFLKNRKRSIAVTLAVAMVMTSTLPSAVWADNEIGGQRGITGIELQRDDSTGQEKDERSVATPTEAEKVISTASNAALTKAVKSFNSKVTFVDTEGQELSGKELNIPETATSFPYLSQGKGRTKGNIDLDSYGYEEKEYFLKGNANVYNLKNDDLATQSNAEYVNRIIVFQPKAVENFKGAVYVDILNASSKVDVPDIWRRSYDFFMTHGYIYVGVTSKDVNVAALKKFDSNRYRVLDWEDETKHKSENGLIWDMLGQLGALLKQDNSPLLYGGNYSGSVSNYLMGQSQSGWYINTFSNNFGPANHLVLNPAGLVDIDEAKDYPHIYDGFFDIVGGLMEAPIATGQASRRFNEPAKPSEVPFILMVGENDYSPAPVRADSDAPGDLYRHYVVAGASHSNKIFLPDPMDEIQIRAGRPAGDFPPFTPDTKTGNANTASDMNMDVFVNAALENLHNWSSNGIVAPHGPSKEEIKETVNGRFVPERDKYGNMTTGIMSPQLTVPVAAYYGGVNGKSSTDGGSMVYLDESIIRSLYKNRDDYLTKFETALDEVIAEGWILETDKERMMEVARKEPIFGKPGKDDDKIESSMLTIPNARNISMKSGSADGTTYTDAEYMMTGKAYMYGVLRENMIYTRRMYPLGYTNYARVCTPKNFTGEVVLDLISNGEAPADVSSLMKAGTAYVGITADPKAAESKNGNWKIPDSKSAGTSKQEPGLLWDIISQTVSAICSENGGLLANTQGKDITITLGYDNKETDKVYTYKLVFNRFDAYGISKAMTGGVSQATTLNSLDSTIPTAPEAVWYNTIHYEENGAGEPVIVATSKNIITADGKYFKDSNDNGKLDPAEDWRLDSETRAKNLVSQMTVDDKIGMMVINSRNMGIYQKDKTKVDATGLLDEAVVKKDESIFGQTSTLGTTDTIEKLKLRHFILRQNPEPEDMASWINQMNLVAESTKYGIPVLVASNSRNENGQMTFGMNDASGVFSTWPGTMGLAAAAKGDIAKGGDASLISNFAEIGRSEWDASGLKKGYMYMADTMTDPRWQRTYGTLGEDPAFVADAIGRIVAGFQGGTNGVQANGVGLTVKHFPGGGARENGFDPHYAQGQWNVYQTENSLQLYHLAGFEAAINNNVSAIMPYYAKPSTEKSKPQYDENGKQIPMEAVGFAFNQAFIKGLLRDQLGHQGYVNSDSGITGNMAWGVEQLEVPERAAVAINAGTDIISDTNDVRSIKEAYTRGTEGYYNSHPVPEGYTVADVTLTEERINLANERLLKEMFNLGLFENPYRDMDNAKAVVDNPENWADAYEAHQKSVVLLKNTNDVLPLTQKKLEGKKVYVEYFAQAKNDNQTKALRENLAAKYPMTYTNDYNEADYALLFVNPASGNYFSATKGYLELDICNEKEVHDVDDSGRPIAATHKETTLANADKIRMISETVRGRGGKVITNVNFTLAWMLGNVEPYSDAVLAGFDTYTDATMDVIVGNYKPAGKMPITLPRSDAVIAVNADGVCISPNDVPGYLKDEYMPESMKDANGKAYAYMDSEGHYYELNYGLTYREESNYSNDSSGSFTDTKKSTGKWIKTDKGWWFEFNNGTWPKAQWISLNWNGKTDWYYFDAQGYMVTGWLEIDNEKYYLHTISDGTMGYMYTGWNQIAGKWYYFNTVSDGAKGRLLVNTTTPDNYRVGADGAWIEK